MQCLCKECHLLTRHNIDQVIAATRCAWGLERAAACCRTNDCIDNPHDSGKLSGTHPWPVFAHQFFVKIMPRRRTVGDGASVANIR